MNSKMPFAFFVAFAVISVGIEKETVALEGRCIVTVFDVLNRFICDC